MVANAPDARSFASVGYLPHPVRIRPRTGFFVFALLPRFRCLIPDRQFNIAMI
jgi:hypothetical protein